MKTPAAGKLSNVMMKSNFSYFSVFAVKKPWLEKLIKLIMIHNMQFNPLIRSEAIHIHFNIWSYSFSHKCFVLFITFVSSSWNNTEKCECVYNVEGQNTPTNTLPHKLLQISAHCLNICECMSVWEVLVDRLWSHQSFPISKSFHHNTMFASVKFDNSDSVEQQWLRLGKWFVYCYDRDNIARSKIKAGSEQTGMVGGGKGLQKNC